MGFLTTGRQARATTLTDIGVSRVAGPRVGTVQVNPDTALAHSAVWAALRVRADILSTIPVCLTREVAGRQVEQRPTPFFEEPSSDDMTWPEWTHALSFDADRVGTTVGIVMSRDGNGLPRHVDLVGERDVSIIVRGPKIKEVRAWGELIPEDQVWLYSHNRPAGSPIGLSAIAYAARTIGSALSAQQAAADHWKAGLNPGGVLRNTERRRVDPAAADLARDRFAAAVQSRGLFVTGADWEWKPVDVAGVNSTLLDELQWSVADVARFIGVPGDLIDAAQAGSSVTYANVMQRNLQYLVHYLNPVLTRLERRLSLRSTPAGWGCHFNAEALLRMDPAELERLLIERVNAKVLTNDEAREARGLMPLTDEQIARMGALAAIGTKSQSVAETVQKTYLGVGTILTADEARAIVNDAGANLPIPGPALSPPSPSSVPALPPGGAS